jgi:hypothetical protein
MGILWAIVIVLLIFALVGGFAVNHWLLLVLVLVVVAAIAAARG